MGNLIRKPMLYQGYKGETCDANEATLLTEVCKNITYLN